MKVVEAPRASSILYNILKSKDLSEPWLVPANVCPIVPITFFKAKTPFEFIDISPSTLNMDYQQAERRLEQGAIGGLLYVHTYGEPTVPREFFRRIKSAFPDSLIVDDRCLCLPDTRPDQDSLADVTLYSTGYAKVVDFGFGGYAFLREGVSYRSESQPYDPRALLEVKARYEEAIRLKLPYQYRECDWLQMDDSVGWVDYFEKIRDALDKTLRHRAAINEAYAALLPEEIQLPGRFQGWRFNLRLKKRDEVLDAIFASGLFASGHFASLASIMAPAHCPHAENLANEALNLFNDHRFSLEMARQVCSIIMDRLA